MKAFSVLTAMFTLGIPALTLADFDIRFSENGSTINGVSAPALDNIFKVDKSDSVKSYVQKGDLSSVSPEKNNTKLADSIEFEVYEIGENFSSHSVYLSGAGICRGYSSQTGVELMDSSTYNIKGTAKDYYSSISSATLSAMTDPRNVQYSSVFNISDAQKAQEVRAAEAKYGRQAVDQTVRERETLLSHKVCRNN